VEEDEFEFQPDRGAGLAFQAAGALILLGASLWGLWRALNTQLGPLFLLYLVPALLAALLVPLLAYRAFSLWKAYYRLERDGITLHWGLRGETIPINQVLWVRRAEEALHQVDAPLGELQGAPAVRPAQIAASSTAAPAAPLTASPAASRAASRAAALPLPRLRWPGGVLGERSLPGDGPFGVPRIEYLADRTRDLVLIATREALFAISPSDTAGFLDAYRRCSELGSTKPLESASSYPTFLLARVWRTPIARALLLVGLLLNLALLAVVTVAIPARTEIILGSLETGEPAPAIRLMMLPMISVFFYLLNLFLGLFFFRLEGRQPELAAEESGGQERGGEAPSGWSHTPAPSGPILAYLLWGASVVTALFFMAAVAYILTQG
jgi:hypothetical protein